MSPLADRPNNRAGAVEHVVKGRVGDLMRALRRAVRPGVSAGFFTVLAEQLTFNDFQVLDLIASGDRVAAEIRLDVTSKASGERIVSDEVHLWTFDDHGRVVVFRHYVDTAKHMAAAGVG